MKEFVKKHPVISYFIGLFIVTGVAILLGWATGGPATAGRFGSIVFNSYIIYGAISLVINLVMDKYARKKTGKGIQELIEQREKEEKEEERRRKNKQKNNNPDDDYDDGL